MEFNFTVLRLVVELQDQERNWASVKLKSQQLFIQTIERRTVKFNYCKVFMPYGSTYCSLIGMPRRRRCKQPLKQLAGGSCPTVAIFSLAKRFFIASVALRPLHLFSILACLCVWL